MIDWPTVKELTLALSSEDAEFTKWARAMPDKSWAKYDLSAVRVGFILGQIVAAQRIRQMGDLMP